MSPFSSTKSDNFPHCFLAALLQLDRETLRIKIVASSVQQLKNGLERSFVSFNKFRKIFTLVVVFSWIVYSGTLDTAHGLTQEKWVLT